MTLSDERLKLLDKIQKLRADKQRYASAVLFDGRELNVMAEALLDRAIEDERELLSRRDSPHGEAGEQDAEPEYDRPDHHAIDGSGDVQPFSPTPSVETGRVLTWRKTRTDPPKIGGTYTVGGYIDGPPRTFLRGLATCVLTQDGPSWSWLDGGHHHIPMEYWHDTLPHPELSASPGSSAGAATDDQRLAAAAAIRELFERCQARGTTPGTFAIVSVVIDALSGRVARRSRHPRSHRQRG